LVDLQVVLGWLLHGAPSCHGRIRPC
jgi:hypothetical protein